MLRKKTIGLALAGAMILPTGSVFADENLNSKPTSQSVEKAEPQNFTEILGWSELESDKGQLQHNNRNIAAGPSHAGWAEYKDGKRRAVGETTWNGVYHYTRAQLQLYLVVMEDSGRQWDWNDTRAESPWGKEFYSARTWYGNEK
ncbi:MULTISPECIES: hypothetical protein [Bacillus cereus group]|uniref:Lactococcin 972 family bacteriocin n=1 Tax=Bacillus thuringiensis subsp. jegathesan TaxID=56955 RepID=A0A9X6QVB4_BACTJ|nr:MULTISPECIES: hypothetical protein [Bacillus cereus group]MDM5370310.1 hypothetical protein [Bacillus bombysepticus]MCR6789978.1 hypothetical protein [Bacillus thuringiensis]MCR6825958.1 hypothetical protein [Bacillus thuringiensis]MCR6831810.1 hypothetical protein [Bacillus thuringiensis]MEB9327308.1 hypothetical protein [Bacillus cereus]